MADEKKPDHGTDDLDGKTEAKAPENEISGDEIRDEVSDGTDADLPEGDTGPDTPAQTLTGPDTLPGEDAGSDALSGDATDTISGDGTEEPEGVDTLSDATDEPIHSVGEAEALSEDAGRDTLGSASEGPASRPEETIAPAPVPVVQEKIVERRGGFFPMLIGGVVAAGLGWGASAYTSGTWPFVVPDDGPDFEAEARGALADQTSRIEVLSERVEEVSGQVSNIDLSGVETSIGDVRSGLDASQGEFSSLKEALANLDARIVALEKKPVEDSVSPEAMAAYERELEGVRKAIEEQRAEVRKMTDEALAAEANAEEQAVLARARAALSDVNAALVSGEPYATELGVIEANGIAVPAALSAPATDGVATMAILTEAFPPLARDTLASARRAEAEGESGTRRFATFMANQLGARSVEPKDGASVDAILSRAEAALREGDLATSLDELDTLPEEAKAELSGWLDQARTRQGALEAADQVALELNKE
ncbi:COG4223 family protein [Salipiger sp.]|uniref:COG4223 family protein n=1 Tax=Salipiger sp. TaxID=2078585 RepID=UPI003A97897C